MKNVIIDVDDTVLDYTSKCLGYANVHTPTDTTFKNICDYLTHVHSYTYEQVQELIVDFNHSEYFKYLEPLKGSSAIIKQLDADGVNIHAITSCGNSDTIRKNRMHNIHSVFGNVFNSVQILPLMSSKIDALKRHTSDDVVFVEDTLAHYYDAMSLGIDSYIIKGQMNKCSHRSDIRTFEHWDEFYNLYNMNHK